MISEAAGADLYEIKPKVLYTKADLDWMNKKSRSSVEMSDKKITLFATSGGSGFGNTINELQPSAPGAEFVEGGLLNMANRQEIEKWVDKTLA